MAAPVSVSPAVGRMVTLTFDPALRPACHSGHNGERRPEREMRSAILMFLACLVLWVIVGLRASVGAEIAPIPLIGPWHGGAYSNDSTGKFNGCIATVPYHSGITMAVAVFANYSWSLGFGDQAWNMKIGQQIPLVFSFDGGPQWGALGHAINRHFVGVPMEPKSALVAAFRGAHSMTVFAPGGTYFFNLDGTSSVFAELVRCVGLELAPAQPDTVPSQVPNAGTHSPSVAAPASSPTGDLGSGLFVTVSGLVLTNAHVVDRCRQIDVRSTELTSAARLIARDSVDDLALLATDLHPQAIAALRLSARQGDAIAVYGFPLPGLLAPVGNVTFGNITALAGLRGNSGEMQISAPVQPGNSGGPVLDASGDVVGVVVSKLNALRVAAATRDIPQNVNFAIKAAVASDFLQAQGVTFMRGKAAAPLSSAALAATARPFTGTSRVYPMIRC